MMHPRRVLLAEDDDELRIVLAKLLEMDGYQVTSVTSGAALLAALRSFDLPPAAVISDERMPGMRGLHALRCARQGGAVSPLILITAFDDDSVVVEADDVGAALLSKPFDVADLRALLGAGATGEAFSCAACKSGRDLRAIASEGGVFFCGECRGLFDLFEPDDPSIDVGVGD